MQALETRPFESRFGTHCPFCGRSWGDPTPCGDSRADRTIRDGLRLLFADKVDNCVVCDKQVRQGKKYCLDCALNIERYRNRQDRHARKTGTCAHCGGTFERRSDKKQQRFCGYACSNRARAKAA